MIQLSKRLNAVAELLVHGIDQLELEQPVLADIGTDHAYLPVYLVQKKVVKKAYAADVRKGPLLHAKEHIEQYGLGEYRPTRLSDGGESFVPGESEVAVIAGMGGGLMQKILSGSPEFFEKNSCVVLQHYLKREAKIYRELLEKLSAISDRPEIQKRIHEVEKKAEQTERAIQEMSK